MGDLVVGLPGNLVQAGSGDSGDSCVVTVLGYATGDWRGSLWSFLVYNRDGLWRGWLVSSGGVSACRQQCNDQHCPARILTHCYASHGQHVVCERRSAAW